MKNIQILANKNGKKIVVLALATSSLLMTTGADASSKDAAPSFAACSKSKVRMVHDQSEMSSLPKGCAASVIYAAPASMTLTGTNNTALKIGLSLQKMIKEDYLPGLANSKRELQTLQACFEAKLHGSVSADCQKRMANIENQYGTFVGSLRQDLHAWKAAEDDGTLVPLGDLGSAIHLRGLLPNPYPESVKGAKLYPTELKFSQNLAKTQKSWNKTKAESRAAYSNTLEKGLMKDKLFLISELPAPHGADGNARPYWTVKQWLGVIEKQMQNTDIEMKNSKELADSFPKMNPLHISDFVPVPPKDDLLTYVAMKPLIEKYLQKHPEDCGLMIAGEEWRNNIQKTKGLAQMGAMFAGGFGTSAARDLEELGILGKMGSKAAQVVQWSGGAAGASVVAAQVSEAKHDAKSMTRKEEVAPDAIDPNAYKAAQETARDLPAEIAGSIGGFWVGTKVAGKAVQKGAPYVIAQMYSKANPEVQAFLDRAIMNMKPAQAKVFLEKVASGAEKSKPMAKNVEVNMAHAKRIMALADKVDALKTQLITEGKLEPADMQKVDELLVKIRQKHENAHIAKGETDEDAIIRESAAETAEDGEQAAKSCGIKAGGAS